MNKYKILIISFFCVLIYACQKEESLSPSYADVDRVAMLVDLDKPLVKEYYENYNKGILYEFDDTLDFVFHLGRNYEAVNWGQLHLVQLQQQKVDSALEFLDTTLFAYLKNEIEFNGIQYQSTRFKELLPRTMLVYDTIENDVQAIAYKRLSESDAAPKKVGFFNTLYNSNGFAFAVDPTKLAASVNTAKNVRNDNFYQIVGYVLDNGDLYNEIPEAFFEVSGAYYGRDMVEVYIEDGYEPDYNDDGTINTYMRLFYTEYGYKGYQDKTVEWLSEKGFVLTDNLYDPYLRYYGSYRRVYYGDTFWDLKRDVRTYVNEMIFGTADEFEAHAEATQNKLRVLIETFMNWGVDFIAFNPDLEVLYNNSEVLEN